MGGNPESEEGEPAWAAKDSILPLRSTANGGLRIPLHDYIKRSTHKSR